MSESGPPTNTTLIADSGATASYIGVNIPLQNMRKAPQPITIRNPNGTTMISDQIGDIDLPMLRQEARTAYYVPQLKNCNLLSIGTICNAGYKVEFEKEKMTVCDGNDIVLHGVRNMENGLWMVKIASTVNKTVTQANEYSPHIFNAMHAGNPTEADMVAFAHATLFSPAISTLENALRKNFINNIQGLNLKSLSKHQPNLMATANGHMDLTRQQTKHVDHATITQNTENPDEIADYSPTMEEHDLHTCFVAIFENT